MTKKIAILGSAPSSIQLAPFNDPSWQIWGCSPGCYPLAKRVNAWFEIHRWEPGQPWFSKEYVAWMAALDCPVYMIKPVPEIPVSQSYPINAIMNYVYCHTIRDGVVRQKTFDPSDFSSSIAWMIALAIAEGATEIGLWGVDMSAQEEWFFQRSGCQSLINAAQSIGIKITVPGESDLLRPPPLYGFCEVDPAHIKGLARKAELLARINNAALVGQNAQRELDAMKGAYDQLEYNMKTWVGNPCHLGFVHHQEVDPVTFEPLHPTADASAAVAPAAPVGPEAVTGDDWRALEGTLDRGGSPVIIPPSTAAELLAALDGLNGTGAPA